MGAFTFLPPTRMVRAVAMARIISNPYRFYKLPTLHLKSPQLAIARTSLDPISLAQHKLDTTDPGQLRNITQSSGRYVFDPIYQY